MIDQAAEENVLAGYFIIIGHTPLTSLAYDDLAWLRGHKTYRQHFVAYSSSIPSATVLLSPAADNYQLGEVVEYHGHIDSGTISRQTLYL